MITTANPLVQATTNSSTFGTPYSFTGAIALNTVLVGPITNSGYNTFTFELTSVGTSGGLVVEVSNDNSTWYNIYGFNPVSGLISSKTLGGNGILAYSVSGIQYIRVRVSVAITGGTTSFTYGLSSAVYTNVSFTQQVQLTNQSLSTGYSSYAFQISQAGAYTPVGISVKNSATSIGFISVSNNSNNPAYLHLVNSATTPTVGTSTNVFAIPSVSGSGSMGVAHYTFDPIGMLYNNGLGFYISLGPLSNDTGSVAGNTPITLNIGYI